MDLKLLVGLHRDDIARRIKNPKQRKMLTMLGMLWKKSPGTCSKITNSCVGRSPESRSARTLISASLTISPSRFVLILHDIQDEQEKMEWSQFSNAHYEERVLIYIKREVLNADMRVKTKLTKQIGKQLT